MLFEERRARQQEGLQCARKYQELQTDKEDLQKRISRECGQLESRLQALERRQLEERQCWIEERTRLEQQCGDFKQQLESCEAAKIIVFSIDFDRFRSLFHALSMRQAKLEGMERDSKSTESAFEAKYVELQALEKAASLQDMLEIKEKQGFLGVKLT